MAIVVFGAHAGDTAGISHAVALRLVRSDSLAAFRDARTAMGWRTRR
jgi:hypothetical protein